MDGEMLLGSRVLVATGQGFAGQGFGGQNDENWRGLSGHILFLV